jgi:hypothetical protein
MPLADLKSAGSMSPGSFSPTQVAGLVVWYDFADISSLWKDTARTTPVTADADEIRGVTDKSGNAHHLQASQGATTYPLYKVNIQNGKSVSRHNGNDQVETVDQITLSNDYTIFQVMSRTSTVNVQNGWDGDVGAGPRNFQTRLENAANTFTFLPVPGSGASATVTISAAGTVDIISITCVSNTVNGAKAYANGVHGTDATPPVTVTTARVYALGSSNTPAAGPAGTVQPITGDFCEIIQYNTALSAANHNAVGTYLATKWGKTWTTVT